MDFFFIYETRSMEKHTTVVVQKYLAIAAIKCFSKGITGIQDGPVLFTFVKTLVCVGSLSVSCCDAFAKSVYLKRVAKDKR